MLILSKFNIIHKVYFFPGDMKLKCPWCEECCANIEAFINHQKLHNENANGVHYLCNLCRYSTSMSCNIRTHLMRHYGLKPFKCSICGFCFVEKAKLKRHILSHYTGTK